MNQVNFIWESVYKCKRRASLNALTTSKRFARTQDILGDNKRAMTNRRGLTILVLNMSLSFFQNLWMVYT